MPSDWQSQFYPESNVGGFTHVDGTIAFYQRVASVLDPSSVVLEVGCGRGAYAADPVPVRRTLRVLRGRVGRVIGIDVDTGAAANPCVDEFRLIENPDRWPVADHSIDICVADWVLEHVERPSTFLAECARVVREDGYVCIRTPNRYHYVAVWSRLLPNRFHARVLRSAQPEREARDVFPTLYRCNTRRQLKRMMESAGFSAWVYAHEAEPSYLAFSKPLYFLGVLYQRWAPPSLRAALFAFGRRRRTDATTIDGDA